MFANLDIFKMSSTMASHSGRRQALAAQNMANVDTPDYRASRLPSFSEIVDTTSSSGSLRNTRDSHISHDIGSTMSVRIQDGKEDLSPDGNSVSAELELLESIAAEREHKRALSIYKSALNVLHTAASGR